MKIGPVEFYRGWPWEVFHMARCHNCNFEMPFWEISERDEWVAKHREACRNPIDTWKYLRRMK